MRDERAWNNFWQWSISSTPDLMEYQEFERSTCRSARLKGSEAQRNGWLIISDGNLVSGLLVGMLRRSEPGLAKGLVLKAYVGGIDRKFESFVEGMGYFKYDPPIPELRSLT